MEKIFFFMKVFCLLRSLCTKCQNENKIEFLKPFNKKFTFTDSFSKNFFNPIRIKNFNSHANRLAFMAKFLK